MVAISRLCLLSWCLLKLNSILVVNSQYAHEIILGITSIHQLKIVCYSIDLESFPNPSANLKLPKIFTTKSSFLIPFLFHCLGTQPLFFDTFVFFLFCYPYFLTLPLLFSFLSPSSDRILSKFATNMSQIKFSQISS